MDINDTVNQFQFAELLAKYFPKADYTWMQLSGLMRACPILEKFGYEKVSYPDGHRNRVIVYKRIRG